MLRFALRRLFWSLPTLFGISLLVFYLTTLIAEPGDLPATLRQGLATGDFGRYYALVEERRMQGIDLPRFFNGRPVDVRQLVDAAVAQVTRGGPEAKLGAAELGRIGGAAFPYLLPRLEQLPPRARGAVAVALGPIAVRMGVASLDELRDPEGATHFWARFWEDRVLDFTEPAVRRDVRRLVKKGTELREQDLRQADTFAVDELVAALPSANAEALVRLTRLLARSTGRGAVASESNRTNHARVVEDWQSWWYVHRSDYVALDGAERVVASFARTRYGLWALRAATGKLGESSRDGEPVLTKMLARSRVTALVTVTAMLASFTLAFLVGVATAWRRGRALDLTMGVALLLVYSVPTFLLAQLLASVVDGPPGAFVSLRTILAIVTLTCAALGTLSRHQRSAMLEVVRQDYVRTAHAKGLSRTRVLVVHALRNALVPMIALGGLQVPTLLGGALVVEEVFALPGVGYETLRAVESHDVPWLMATVLVSALLAALLLVASDFASALLDPRLRERLGAHTRARA